MFGEVILFLLRLILQDLRGLSLGDRLEADFDGILAWCDGAGVAIHVGATGGGGVLSRRLLALRPGSVLVGVEVLKV